jgi:hypothetical protein
MVGDIAAAHRQRDAQAVAAQLGLACGQAQQEIGQLLGRLQACPAPARRPAASSSWQARCSSLRSGAGNGCAGAFICGSATRHTRLSAMASMS